MIKTQETTDRELWNISTVRSRHRISSTTPYNVMFGNAKNCGSTKTLVLSVAFAQKVSNTILEFGKLF